MEEIIILGNGGHARSLADTLLLEDKYNLVGFVSKNGWIAGVEYRGIKIIGADESLEDLFKSGIRCAAIGVGYLGKGNIRNKLYDNLKRIGFELPVIKDKKAIVASDVNIDEGTFVGKGAIINTNVNIGKMCIINSGAIVEHDCVVKDYSHIACGSVLCGGVAVGRGTLIGANATVIEGIYVPDNALVPAGHVVTRNDRNNMIKTNDNHIWGGWYVEAINSEMRGGALCA